MALYRTANLGVQALSTTAKAQIFIVGLFGSPTRTRVSELTMGGGVPDGTDCQIIYDIASWDGVAGIAPSALTSQKLNPADVATTLDAKGDFGSQPGTDKVFESFTLNQRQSQTWRASRPDHALVFSASLTEAFMVRAYSPTFTGAVRVSTIHEEF